MAKRIWALDGTNLIRSGQLSRDLSDRDVKMEMMLDTLALELVRHGPGASHRAVSSLIRAAPARSKVEGAHFELKRE